MKTSMTVAFTALFVIVAGVYFYLLPASESEFGQIKVEERTPMRLLSLEDDDELTWIQINNREEKDSLITLKKEDEEWMIKYPLVYPANHIMVEGLVSALTVSKKARRLNREKGWEEYGLLKPSIKIGIETSKVKNRRYLFLGDSTAIGDFVFARWDGEDEYFLLDKDMKKAFSRSVYSLRLKKVFRMPINKISKIRFRTTSEEYEIARHDDQWFWMEPIPVLGELISKEDIDRIRSLIFDLYVKEFLDGEQREKEELGFQFLGRSIKVWGENEEEGSEVLLLGESIPTRDGVYAKLENEDTYFLVARSNLDALYESVKNLAKRYLMGEKQTNNLLG